MVEQALQAVGTLSADCRSHDELLLPALAHVVEKAAPQTGVTTSYVGRLESSVENVSQSIKAGLFLWYDLLYPFPGEWMCIHLVVHATSPEGALPPAWVRAYVARAPVYGTHYGPARQALA